MATAWRVTRWVACGVALTLGGVACLSADRQGHLYAVRDGSKGVVVLHGSSATRGSVEAVLASGTRCAGTFSTTPDAVTRADEDHRILEEQTQIGMLLLTCGNGQLIKCGFSRDPWAGGLGQCRDTGGVEYSLVL